jgi:hypothetical protein
VDVDALEDPCRLGGVDRGQAVFLVQDFVRLEIPVVEEALSGGGDPVHVAEHLVDAHAAARLGVRQIHLRPAYLQGGELRRGVATGALHVHGGVARAAAVGGEVGPDLADGTELHVVGEERVVAGIEADRRKGALVGGDGRAGGSENQERSRQGAEAALEVRAHSTSPA